jgi:hypothetical protein
MRAFEKEALRLIACGEKQLRAQELAERSMGEQGVGSIQNSMLSYYGRAFAIKHPQYKKLFVFKETTGVKKLWAA